MSNDRGQDQERRKQGIEHEDGFDVGRHGGKRSGEGDGRGERGWVIRMGGLGISAMVMAPQEGARAPGQVTASGWDVKLSWGWHWAGVRPQQGR